jgi:hypothetical protein
MLALTEIDRIVTKAAKDSLKGKFIRAASAYATDSEGQDALDLTIVLAKARVSGDAALDAIVRIQHDLSDSGEERLPIVHFATESELADASAEP